MTGRSHEVALATDLYQMTMGAAYAATGMQDEAVFSLFVRRLPASRSYLVAAGLEDALTRLEALRFDDAALTYLRSTGQVREDFIEQLRDFRFQGEVRAVPEGTVVFPEEPLLEVRGSIIEAQLAETIIINAMHYATLIATKAARCIHAAPEASLVEFGLRRTPSIEAGVIAARSAYLAGFVGTSNLLAGEQYGIPVSGTVAHSFIQAFSSEVDALRAFASTFPGPVTLLIDTYDTIRGAHHTVAIARELERNGGRVAAVRIDSGDVLELSRAVRAILDESGFQDIQIIASGGLDEHQLAELHAQSAPIDAYGIGTSLGTSADAPSLDMVYKLVQYAGEPRLKLSTGKRTLGGAKQVWRMFDADGYLDHDLISLRDEPAPNTASRPLLETVMEEGRIIHRPTLDEIRERHRAEMRALPARLLALDAQAEYRVALSPPLVAAQEEVERVLRENEGSAP